MAHSCCVPHACEVPPQRTELSNTLVGFIPKALLITRLIGIPLVLTSWATTCKDQQWKTTWHTREITKPPPLIGGGVSRMSLLP